MWNLESGIWKWRSPPVAMLKEMSKISFLSKIYQILSLHQIIVTKWLITYILLIFLYEIFRTHYIFYACCPSAFGLATFQVISCHLRLYRVALGQGLANFFCEKSDRNILGLWTQFLLHSIVSFIFVSVFKDTFKNIKAIFSSCMIQLQAASGYDFQSPL